MPPDPPPAGVCRELLARVGPRRLAAAAAGLAVAYAAVLAGFLAEGAEQVHRVGATEAAGRFGVRGTLALLDVNRGACRMHLDFTPAPALCGPDGVTLREDLVLVVNTGTGVRRVPLAAGRPVPPVELELTLFDGDPAVYPFDRHTVHFEVEVERPSPFATAQSGRVPVGLVVRSRLHGFAIDRVVETAGAAGADGFEPVELTVRRSGPVRLFAFLVMGAMWGVTLIIAWMTLAIRYGGYKIEMNMVTFMASALFIFPAIRNLMPGVPPLGALPDYLTTFWVEAITAFCLALVVWEWTRRRPT